MSTFVKPLTCITAFFDGCGFANYQSSRSWSVSENAHSSWTTWYIRIKMHTCVFKHCPAKLWRGCWENLKRKILSKITIYIYILNENYANPDHQYQQYFGTTNRWKLYSLSESVCPFNLLSTHSIWRRILVNLRSPRVVHITVSGFWY